MFLFTRHTLRIWIFLLFFQLVTSITHHRIMNDGQQMQFAMQLDEVACLDLTATNNLLLTSKQYRTDTEFTKSGQAAKEAILHSARGFD